MWRDEAYLLDMLLAARKARRFAAEVDQAGFERNELHQFAIVRALEIIGEAAGKVSDDVRHRHPDIPWREVIGMRNRLIHEYTHVRLDIVWAVVEVELPRLIEQLEPLVPPPDA